MVLTNAIHVGQSPIHGARRASIAPYTSSCAKNKGYDYARTNHPNRKRWNAPSLN